MCQLISVIKTLNRNGKSFSGQLELCLTIQDAKFWSRVTKMHKKKRQHTYTKNELLTTELNRGIAKKNISRYKERKK